MEKQNVNPIFNTDQGQGAGQPAGKSTSAGNWLVLLILVVPSIYVFLTVPPLWRDSDGFNQISSTFAPKGIIHWLPGYCFFGRLIVIVAGIIGSLLQGKGLPYLSLGTPALSDAGIYALIVVQHLFLVFALWYLIRTLTDRFVFQLLFAAFFALTPWMYIFANCVGSEAFSNPLVLLIAAIGGKCLNPHRQSIPNSAPESGLKYSEKTHRWGFFAVLLAATLTRQINNILAALLPISALILWGAGWIRRRRNTFDDSSSNRYGRKFLIFTGIGILAIVSSILIQQTMCLLFRVPYRSTLGETFEWRLSYLHSLSVSERTAILERTSKELNDPVITEALEQLNRSLSNGDKWTDMFLFYAIDGILVKSGINDTKVRTYQIDRKLSRIARSVLLSGEPHYLKAVWTDFFNIWSYSQADLAHPPFILTDWLRTQVDLPRYARLKPLASFQHAEGYFEHIWEQQLYFHVFDGIPMLWFAAIAIVLGAFAWRTPAGLTAVSYSAALIATAILIVLATSATSFAAARFFLPTYSLLQISVLAMIQAVVGWRAPRSAALSRASR
jgi:hypothetical protein